MKNDELEVLDLMVEAGGFSSRGECVRAFIRPAFDMAKVAMETKSIRKCFGARVSAEKELMDHINLMIKNSEVQGELFGDLPQVGVASA